MSIGTGIAVAGIAIALAIALVLGVLLWILREHSKLDREVEIGQRRVNRRLKWPDEPSSTPNT